MGRKYSAMTSAPHLKLRSNLELKTLFSINDFRLPPCLEGMYGPVFLMTILLSVSINLKRNKPMYLYGLSFGFIKSIKLKRNKT